MKTRILLIGLIVTLAAVTVFGQSNLATITGTVTDQSGAVVANAQVTATNVGTNAATTVTSNAQGYYTIVNLPIGTYALSVDKAGFKHFERKGLTLEVSQIAQINVVLPVGAQSETVEVTGDAPLLQTQSAELSTNLNNQAVTNLPLNVAGGRTLSKFMFAFVPGVEGDDYNSHINGSVALSKEVMIDGTSAVAQLGGYLNESQPPMESIQEFQVSTAGISADEGRTGGGVFRYEMKSGTNQWHGSLFGFMHDSALDAISAANKLAMQRDPSQASIYGRKNETLSDWGGSFGGPIVKDKLFFYTGYERYMASNWQVGTLSGTVPTDAMMGLNPDGSWAQYADLSNLLNTSVVLGTDDLGNTIYQGAIFYPGTRTVFVNNQIPTSMISTTTAKILQLYHKYYAPQSNLPQNNAMPSPLPWNHINEFSVKLDYNASEKNHINGSFIYNMYPRILADQGGIWSLNSQYGGPLANSYQHNTTAPSIRLADTYTVTPNLMNSFRFTLNRFRNPSIAKSQSGAWDQALGLGSGAGNFPLIGFDAGMYGSGAVPSNGWYMSPIGSQFNDYYAANTFIYNDDVSWVKGRHTFKFGAEFRAMQFNSHPDSGTFNNIVFDPVSTAPWDFWNYWDNVGSAYASFLLGDALRASRMESDPNYGRRKTFSVYATDNMKVTSKLTVNMDLRWDYNSPYKEKYGHWSSFVLDKKNPVTGLMGTYEYLANGSQTFQTRQYWFNFAPHIGAAYEITPKTVLRGSFSVFYVPLNMNTWGGVPYQQTGNPGFHANNSAGAFNWDNGYPGVITQLQTPDYTQWGAVSIDPRGLMPGNSQQLNVGVQRELSKDMKLDVSFIQNHSYHLQSGTLLTNQPTVANMQKALPNIYDPANWPSSYNGYYNGCIWGGTCPNYVAILPYPQAAIGYGPLFTVGSPLGNGDYRALQFTVTKRAAHGLSLLGSYVYSATHGDVDTSMQELWWTGSLQNIYDLASERKGIASFDMTHIVKGYVTYDLPFGRGRSLFSSAGNLTDKLIGGWSLNLAYHYNTGTPIQVHSSNNYPGFNAVYVNLVPGCSLTSGSYSLNQTYLNKACFQNPAQGQLGTAGNYISAVRNPGLATEDLGLNKSMGFGPGERYKLSLRLEFFNVLNRSQLAGPNTNLTDPNFGKIMNYTNFGGRVGQFGARITF
jgi:hypothetical protein